jgi:hypothetical protein
MVRERSSRKYGEPHKSDPDLEKREDEEDLPLVTETSYRAMFSKNGQVNRKVQAVYVQLSRVQTLLLRIFLGKQQDPKI